MNKIFKKTSMLMIFMFLFCGNPVFAFDNNAGNYLDDKIITETNLTNENEDMKTNIPNSGPIEMNLNQSLESTNSNIQTYAVGSQEAYIDFSKSETISNGIELVTTTNESAESYTYKTQIAGENCIKIGAKKQGYFKVDKNIISSTDANLYFEITYYDSDGYGLSLQYNSSDTSMSYPQYKSSRPDSINSGTWRTVGMFISDAALNGLQNNKADFRINSNSFIKSIKISKKSADADNEPQGKRYGKGEFNEFSGKSCTGYQGWFTTGGRNDNWIHWGGGVRESDGTSYPRPNSFSFDVYPDIKDYAEDSLAETGFSNLGSGESSKLFDSRKEDVINTHFKWMKDYGIDGAAVQRFVGVIRDKRTVPITPENQQLTNIKNAAENNNRIFYIMYDISGGREDTSTTTYVDDIKFDWAYNIEKAQSLLSSKAYATVNGKPVVCLWGLGVSGRPQDTALYQELVNFFRERGCYIIFGTAKNWRSQNEQYINIYKQADMISPWYVGSCYSKSSCDYAYNNSMKPDIDFCNSNNIKYYPCIFPGFSWTTWQSGKPNAIPRQAGEFLWYQAYKVKQFGLNSFYLAMFDEYDEGTAIMKNASDYFDIPTNQYFVTASADGYWLSSDYQLRVAGEAIKMAKGTIPANEDVSVAHSNGPIYYRNSFESMYVNCAESKYNGYYPVDPCFNNPQKILGTNISNDKTEILQTAQAKTGNYAVNVTGQSTNASSSYLFKIADTKINLTKDMILEYDYLPLNELGKNIKITLQFDDGTFLTEEKSLGANTVNINQWNNISYPISSRKYAGKNITAILVKYEGTQKGDFNSYIDNIVIKDSVYNNITGKKLSDNKAAYSSSIVGNNTASNVVDNNVNTRWESNSSDPQWVMIDLKSVCNITGVKLNWETAAGKDYKIQVSNDNKTWLDAYTRTNGTGDLEQISFSSPTKGRYIRLLGTARTTNYGYSLWEFEVYGYNITSNISTKDVDLALNKNITASSYQSGLDVSNAVDGNSLTRWSSDWDDNQWIYVDLGTATSISKVILNWENAYGKAYKVQTSNDAKTWNDCYIENNGKPGITEIPFTSTTARYVRILGLQRGSGYGYSLWSFEVYK